MFFTCLYQGVPFTNNHSVFAGLGEIVLIGF